MTAASPGGQPEFETPTGVSGPGGGGRFSSTQFGGSRFSAATPRERIEQLLASYSRRQQISAAVAVVCVVAAVFVLTKVTGGTEWGALYTDVSASDGGAIVKELDDQGIPHQLANGGSTIMVPTDMVYDTRLKLSDTALPANGKVGYGVLDSQGLTTSEFGQRIGFKRAMEGELSKTIEAIDSVETAVVHLAIPEDQVFALQDQKPSASVLVKTTGGGLSEDRVRAVVNLVASGIEGMSPDDVTVADSQGNVLAAPGQGVNASSGGGTRQRQTEDFESAVSRSLNELLASVVGPGGSKVSVTANLDFDETTVSREVFEKPETGADGSPLVVEESKRDETFTGADPKPAGVLGPDTPPMASTDPGSDYSLKEGDVRYALNRAVESTTKAPGSIEQMSVAVLVDESKLSAAQADDLTRTLAAGANIREDRGDVLTVTRMPFDDTAAKATEAELAEAEAARGSDGGGLLASWPIRVGIVLLVVSAALGYRRMHRRVGRPDLEALERPRDGAIEAGPDGVDALDPATTSMLTEAENGDVLDISPGQELELAEFDPVPVQNPEPAVWPEVAPVTLGLLDDEQLGLEREASLGELIDNQPEEVAALLRGWLADRRGVSR